MNISNLQKIGFSETDVSLQIDAGTFSFVQLGIRYTNNVEVTFNAPKEFSAATLYWLFDDGVDQLTMESASGLGTVAEGDIVKFSKNSLEVVEGEVLTANIAMGPPGIQGAQGVPGDPGAPGEPGADGITVAVSVNGETYSHVGGLITLPDYPSVTSSLELGETEATAYRGDRGKTAYDHSQTAHNKAFVGLSNVDNTSDANKPISSATAAALSGKSGTSHLHTGVYAPALGTNDNYVTDAEKSALHAHSNKTALDAVSGTNTGDQTLSSLGAEPANANIQAHIGSTANPHGVTKTQLGLGNVNNTADANKPISTATQAALDAKAAAAHNHNGVYVKDEVDPAFTDWLATDPIPTDITDLTDTTGVVPTQPADIGAAPALHAHEGVYDIAGSAATAQSNANTYTDNKVSALGAVLVLKGRVDTFDNLPTTGQKVGDVWLVGLVEAEQYREYAWTAANEWEMFGLTTAVDLSDYYTSAQVDTLLSGKSGTGHTHDYSLIYEPIRAAGQNYISNEELATLHSHANKTALDAVSGTNTGDQTLSGLGGVPTSRMVNGYALSGDITLSASDVEAEPDGAVAGHNVSGTAHADLRPVTFVPATMTVNTGTLNAGTVADLAAVGGTDVDIQESNGSNPLTVTFGFTDVTRLSSVHLYLDYLGGASHVINCEIYNNVTAEWDVLGSFSTTTGKVWRSFEIFMPNNYLNAGAVSLRLRHLDNGISTHKLIIDYLDINDGGGGGIGYIGAASVDFTPTGGIAATNVQTALAELDSDKAPASQGVTNGDTHDHSGGDGAQIAYSSLSGAPTSMTPTEHKTAHATGGSDALSASDIGAEPALGNPASDGMVLVSTAAGARSWATGGTGGGGDTYPRGTSFPASSTAGDAFYRTDRKVLYVYEGSWQPIESYGDINLYISSAGNDTTGDCFNPANPAYSLEKAWACIPRLFGGNVNVYVTGIIERSNTSVVRFGGKYNVGGAYYITIIGDDGAVLKSSFTGTVNEANPNQGLISGLSGLTTNEFKGKLLKNVTQGWETTVYENDATSIRAVGKFARSYVTPRTVTTTDSWEVREFGGGFRITGGKGIGFDTPVTLKRLKITSATSNLSQPFNVTERIIIDNVHVSQEGATAIQDGFFLNNCPATSEVYDFYCECLHTAINSVGSPIFINGIGTYISSTSYSAYAIRAVAGAFITLYDLVRLTGAGGSSFGIRLERSSGMPAVASGSWIRNFGVGISVNTYSLFQSQATITDWTGTTIQTQVDTNTSNGTIT